MKKAPIAVILGALLCSVSFMFGSCSDNAADAAAPPEVYENALKAAYQAAIDDAEVVQPWEIAYNLTSIVDYADSMAGSGNLVWDGAPGGERRVLVCTFIAASRVESYATRIGMRDTVKWSGTWVTAVPEVREFIRTHNPGPDTTLRLEQLLGLPPRSGYAYFVEMWVKPADLFRPSPDPEITDNHAELYFPSNASDAHKTWFNANITSSYVHPNGFPWTRLGYTYDWGNAATKEGLSEFVIRRGGVYEVKQVRTISEYCNLP